jgi:glycosyltransferase involved in cell wall biosynthesis
VQKISAYIPAYNNAATLPLALASIRAQNVAIDELFVVDDGSTDGSDALVESLGIKLLRQPRNMGRGAARARAMKEASNEWVLCCDATNVLPPEFVSNAAKWFDDANVAAVFGRITQPQARNVVERWRGRHLFRLNTPLSLSRKAALMTGATLVRRSLVLAAGNFDASLIRNEDADLGKRLLLHHDVIFDPELKFMSIAHNTLSQVLERYWRWNEPIRKRLGFREYLKAIFYSIKVLARHDLKDRDPLSVPISLLCPHVQFFRSRSRLSETNPRTSVPCGDSVR